MQLVGGRDDPSGASGATRNSETARRLFIPASFNGKARLMSGHFSSGPSDAIIATKLHLGD
jgi:hypothetical protein